MDAATNAAHLLNVHILGSVALETTDPATAAHRFRWGLDRLLDGVVAHAAILLDSAE